LRRRQVHLESRAQGREEWRQEGEVGRLRWDGIDRWNRETVINNSRLCAAIDPTERNHGGCGDDRTRVHGEESELEPLEGLEGFGIEAGELPGVQALQGRPHPG